jgi:hypothetical protein
VLIAVGSERLVVTLDRLVGRFQERGSGHARRDLGEGWGSRCIVTG